VQRAPGLPCALFFRRGANEIVDLGQNMSRECGCMFVIVARMSEAISGVLPKFPHVVEAVIGRAFARPVGLWATAPCRYHCITVPESLTTLPHFSVSPCRNAPNASPDSNPGSSPTSESFVQNPDRRAPSSHPPSGSLRSPAASWPARPRDPYCSLGSKAGHECRSKPGNTEEPFAERSIGL
jgi:hypothetical protein